MRYDKYAPTIIRWNSDYPEHWKCEKAKRFFSNPKKINRDGLEDNVLSLTLRGVIRNNKDKPIGLAPEDYSTYQIFNPNELVFKLIDLNNISTSRVGIVPETGIMSSAYIRFVSKCEMNVKYFYYQYYDWYKRNIFNGLGAGVRQTLSGSDLSNLEILFPPRTEQDQIVRYLDWQVSKINKLIAAKKKEISLLDERQRSFVCNLVINGTNPSCKKKPSGINWAEEIPEQWEVLYLSQVSNERSVKNAGMIESNLLSLSYGHIVNKDINTTEGLLPASFEGYQIVLPDNIVLRLTDLQNDHKSLRVGLSTQKGIITSAYTCLNVHDNILPEYLYLQLHAADLCKVFYGMGGGVRQSIGFKDIRKMLIAVPPLDEQKRIVEILKESNAPTEAIIEKLNDEIKKLEELKTRIISDVVTGQIDVRGIEIPEYEYVEEEFDEGEEESDEEIEEQEEE